MLPGLLTELVGGIWMLEPSAASGYLNLVSSLLKGDFNQNKIDYSNERLKSSARFVNYNNEIYQISEYGGWSPPEEAPENSISIINVSGAVTKYDQFCGPSGVETKLNLLQRADKNKNIVAHILNFDTPGGEGYAARAFAEGIRNIEKPVYSFVSDLSASAGVFISSATDGIIANSKYARFGSIGTYVTVADFEKYWEKEGIRLIDIYADKSADKNRDYYEAIKGNTSLIKKDVNKFNELFLSSVKEYRGDKLQAKEEEWGSGKLFFADEALKIGLIDGIGTFDELVKQIYNEL